MVSISDKKKKEKMGGEGKRENKRKRRGLRYDFVVEYICKIQDLIPRKKKQTNLKPS